MKTPKTDEVCKLLIGNSFEGHPLVDLSRSLEVQVQELRDVLHQCYNLMGRGMGIDDYHDMICEKTRAVLEKTK